MEGFLGTAAWLRPDVALVLTWALGVTAVVAWWVGRRRRFPSHCRLMAVAALLQGPLVLVTMLPGWVALASGAVRALVTTRAFGPLAHGALGITAQLLMTYTVVRMNWLVRLPPRRTGRLMRVTMVLWLLAVAGGTGVYLLLYV